MLVLHPSLSLDLFLTDKNSIEMPPSAAGPECDEKVQQLIDTIL
jgi:hypothetical protein